MSDSLKPPPVYTPVPRTEREGAEKPTNAERPLSYFDVVTQIKEAKGKSRSKLDFFLRLCAILFGSCLYLFLNINGRNRCLVSLFVRQFSIHRLYVQNWRIKSDTRQRFMPNQFQFFSYILFHFLKNSPVYNFIGYCLSVPD
jgi:hypothetical protein